MLVYQQEGFIGSLVSISHLGGVCLGLVVATGQKYCSGCCLFILFLFFISFPDAFLFSMEKLLNIGKKELGFCNI